MYGDPSTFAFQSWDRRHCYHTWLWNHLSVTSDLLAIQPITAHFPGSLWHLSLRSWVERRQNKGPRPREVSEFTQQKAKKCLGEVLVNLWKQIWNGKEKESWHGVICPMFPTLGSMCVSSHCTVGDRGLLGQAHVISLSLTRYLLVITVSKKMPEKIHYCSWLESMMAWPMLARHSIVVWRLWHSRAANLMVAREQRWRRTGYYPNRSEQPSLRGPRGIAGKKSPEAGARKGRRELVWRREGGEEAGKAKSCQKQGYLKTMWEIDTMEAERWTKKTLLNGSEFVKNQWIDKQTILKITTVIFRYVTKNWTQLCLKYF